MAARRGDHGISFDRTNNCYVGTISLGYDASGKRKRRSVRGKTKADVREKLRRLQAELDAGIRTSASYTTEQCVEDWLGSLVQDGGTVAGKRSHATTWIYPALGRILVRDLTVADVEKLLQRMSEVRRRRTVAATLSILRNAIRRAQKHGLIDRNVADLADIPATLPARKSRAMTVAQAELVIKETRGTRLHALFVLSFSLGMRPGELRGLRWDDIDLDNRVVKVRRQLKNDWSERTLRVPQIVVDALKRHRDIQAMERENAASLWTESGLVFCHEDGQPYDKDALRWRFGKVTRDLGLGHWHPHEGRHTAVSVLNSKGVKIGQIADFVGHRNDNVTRTVYRHIIEPEITTGADVMDDVFGA